MPHSNYRICSQIIRFILGYAVMPRYDTYLNDGIYKDFLIDDHKNSVFFAFISTEITLTLLFRLDCKGLFRSKQWQSMR